MSHVKPFTKSKQKKYYVEDVNVQDVTFFAVFVYRCFHNLYLSPIFPT